MLSAVTVPAGIVRVISRDSSIVYTSVQISKGHINLKDEEQEGRRFSGNQFESGLNTIRESIWKINESPFPQFRRQMMESAGIWSKIIRWKLKSGGYWSKRSNLRSHSAKIKRAGTPRRGEIG